MVGQTAARLHVPRRLRYLSMHRLGSLVMYRPGMEKKFPTPLHPAPKGRLPPSLAGLAGPRLSP